MGSILRYFPFPLQAFPTRKGPNFCSDWCSEGNLPGSLQQLHRAAPAATKPAGPGDRAQGTAPCSALFTPHLHSSGCGKGFILLCVSWPLAIHSLLLACGCPPFSSIHFGHPKRLVVPGGQAGAVFLLPSRSMGELSFGSHQGSALCTRAVSLLLGEQGGSWNSALEMAPLRKSLSSEGCKPQRAQSHRLPAGRGCRKVGLMWPQASQGLVKGFSQLWLNQVALPYGRQLHCPAPQLTWETFRTCSLLISTRPHPCREGWKHILIASCYELSFTDLRVRVL